MSLDLDEGIKETRESLEAPFLRRHLYARFACYRMTYSVEYSRSAPLQPRHPLWPLTRTIRNWGEVALSFPHLWSALILGFPRCACKIVQ